MTSEHIYYNVKNPHTTPHIKQGGKFVASAHSICVPFVANECKGLSKKQGYTSPYGGHYIQQNADHGSYMSGHWLGDSAHGKHGQVRNEYNLFGFEDHGFGPKPGNAQIGKKGSGITPLFTCYPTFHCSGYFNKNDSSHGFGYSMVDTKGGYPSDVAGVAFNVINFGEGNAIKIRNGSGDYEDVSASNNSYATDWQFNQFWGIYRAKEGHYFSIPFLPNGDNFGGDASKMNVNTGAYVFRNTQDNGTPASTSLGSDSFWSKGKYYNGNKKFRMVLLSDSNTATPRNALFCGIEFCFWIGTEGKASHMRTFQLNEFSVIPDAVAKKIRGKHNQSDFSEFNIIPPKYMRFDDLQDGKTWELNKFSENYTGVSTLGY